MYNFYSTLSPVVIIWIVYTLSYNINFLCDITVTNTSFLQGVVVAYSADVQLNRYGPQQ